MIALVFVLLIYTASQAQHVRIRMGFPVGVSVYAPGPPPYRGAVWVGPEWQWRGGTYVHVPGYWAKPRGRSQWAPGHWKRSRQGYIWIPGRWR